MNRQHWLLALVVTLLVIRFAAVPLQSQRADKKDEYALKQQRLVKGEMLIADEPALRAQAGLLETQLAAAKQQFPTGANEQAVRLNLQRKLSALAESAGLTLESTEWFDGQSDALGHAVLEIRVVGPFKGFAQFNLDLVNQPGLEIQAMRTNVRDQKVAWERLGTVNSTITLDAYYLVG